MPAQQVTESKVPSPNAARSSASATSALQGVLNVGCCLSCAWQFSAATLLETKNLGRRIWSEGSLRPKVGNALAEPLGLLDHAGRNVGGHHLALRQNLGDRQRRLT